MIKSDLKRYLAERLIELLDIGTLDSYRVRNHNILSLLSELSALIEGWSNNKIKQFDTVQHCITETISTIKRDICFDSSPYDQTLFIDDLNKYASIAKNKECKDDKVSVSAELLNSSARIQYIINKYLKINLPSYVENSFHLIDDVISSNDNISDAEYTKVMADFDNVITNLACQLMHSGFSKSKLFSMSKHLFANTNAASFDKEYRNFKDTLISKHDNKYELIYRIQTNKDIDNFSQDFSLIDNVNDVLKNIESCPQNAYCLKYLVPTSGVKFYKISYSAFDHFSAIKKANEDVSKLLDTISFGQKRRSVLFPREVAVISHKGKEVFGTIRDTNFKLDETSENKIDVSAQLHKQLDLISKNQGISKETTDRLYSALRHIRFGNNSAEMELKFINYWIALEFIFSSPATNENTFGRIKKHLINILCTCYIKRNVMFLDSLMKKAKTLTPNENLWEKSDAEWNVLIERETSLLRQYRLCRLKSHLHSTENIKAYISNHRVTLEQHLSRIYRMRNELIHEAAINQDIEAATSNLKYYLTFLISQLIDFLLNVPYYSKPIGIDNFFFEYESRMKMIEKEWDRNTVLNISFVSNMI